MYKLLTLCCLGLKGKKKYDVSMAFPKDTIFTKYVVNADVEKNIL